MTTYYVIVFLGGNKYGMAHSMSVCTGRHGNPEIYTNKEQAYAVAAEVWNDRGAWEGFYKVIEVEV